jgi:acetyltransferase-like isoleucine patch superfamily enzyme
MSRVAIRSPRADAPATAEFVRVFPNVHLGFDVRLEEFVILGQPAHVGEGEPGETWIGEGSLIRSHTVIYTGVRAGARFTTGHHVLVREHTVIGADVSIGSGSIVEHHVMIEDRVRLHSRVFVPEFTRLCSDCWIGPGVTLTNARYPRSPGAKEQLRGPTVMPGAILGANATILPGVVIGARSLIGAGSVVTHDVPERAVVVGNPARVVRSIDELPYGTVVSG